MIVAATGHRPNKCCGYSLEAHNKLLRKAHNWLEENQPNKTISGMALGWDQAWAEASLDLQIPFIAAIPFEGQDKVWPGEARRFYNKLLSKALEVVIVNDGAYAPWKMQTRNQWMVDRADKIIALWDGSEGGTANCLKYARSMNKPIINLWPI